jgi:hypothetical protein
MPFDPYITPWKTASPETGYPDTWPGWTSPDIFVDNTGSRVETTSTAPHTTGPFEYWVNVNEPGEPEIGVADNRLFVVVTNKGSTAGTTQVTVGYTPYALVGGTSTQLQFKQIAQYPVSLGPAGSPTAQLQTEVQWDLSDVTDTNGGLWPLPLGAFNHLCVQVQLTPGNWTQSNFGNVISASPLPIVPLLVVNSDPAPKTYEIVAQNLPEKWSLRLRGIPKEPTIRGSDKVEVALKAGEARFLTLMITNPEDSLKENQLVTLSLLAAGKLVGGLTLSAGSKPAATRQPVRRVGPLRFRPLQPQPVSFLKT